MRPNTPHFVVTLEHAICQGGHFYAFSTIRETCFALYGCFFYGATITNTNHDPSRVMLRKMACYCEQVYLANGFWNEGQLVNCGTHTSADG